MSLLADVTPHNLVSERERFFSSDNFSYNPQFTYYRAFTQDELQKWGNPSKELADGVEKILSDIPERTDFVSENPLAQHDIERILASFFETVGIENELQILFSPDFISRCKLGPGKIMFRQPITYTKSAFMGTIYHEIGTHYLRRLNNVDQPWTRKFRPDISFRETEEGLATLHTYLGTNQPSFFSTYTSYLGLYYAHTLPFNQAFQKVIALNVRQDRAWQLVLRGKRGIEDTSQPIGGLSKDVSYLHGALSLWQWLRDKTNNPEDLYLGRIGLQELDQRKAEARTDHVYLPPFLENKDEYRQRILTLGERNLFQELVDLL